MGAMTKLLELIDKSEQLVEESTESVEQNSTYVTFGSHYLVGEGEGLDTETSDSSDLSESKQETSEE